MAPATLSIHPQFPCAAKCHPDWVLSSSSGAANACGSPSGFMEVLDLKPGMRVLDLGCGRAMSSIFLHRELDWFSNRMSF